jgi:hypothetical protein
LRLGRQERNDWNFERGSDQFQVVKVERRFPRHAPGDVALLDSGASGQLGGAHVAAGE